MSEAHRTENQKVYDYLDHPPKRWRQLGANGAWVQRDDGPWVKFADMDLYMLEGGELMKRCIELLDLGRAVAKEVLQDSTYSGDEAKYWNSHARASRLALFAEGNLERLREFSKGSAT